MTLKKNKIKSLLEALNNEKIETWFDLGLFLDRIKSNEVKSTKAKKLDNGIKKGGIGILSFYFAIDGITVEAQKYYRVLKNIYPKTKIHYIAGKIYPEASELIDTPYQKEIKEIDGFDNWSLYKKFFKEKLERGSKSYNELIKEFWEETLVIVEKLGNYVNENNISLLYLINVCSNPGNVSLSLATVLISEYLGIPVINNNHDFYWEGGNKNIDIEKQNLKKGPRDFFFKNAGVGEFFSIIEMLFPWERKSWINVNINSIQTKKLICKNGHNPSRVLEIGTAIEYKSNISRRQIIQNYKQINSIFSKGEKNIKVVGIKKYLKEKKYSYDPIIFGGNDISNFNFVNNNIIFLQPTRVISRKSIEINFDLIHSLIKKDNFRQKFIHNKELKISIIITGPIPSGQKEYYKKLLAYYNDFIYNVSKEFKSRILLGFLFSEFDKDTFKSKHKTPIDINQLFLVSSLILLPSQTEGRGLPILEASATGIPLFCREYEPYEVYKNVIGYNLNKKERLKVLSFRGNKIPDKIIDKIIDKIFFPQNNIRDTIHNINAIKKRYSYEVLENNIRDILNSLKGQLKIIKTNYNNRIVKKLFEEYKDNNSKYLDNIMDQSNRNYLPGYGKLSFMIYLKSLIDPSFFRVEEQLTKGEIMSYAHRLLKTHNIGIDKEKEKKLSIKFYSLVEEIFYCKKNKKQTIRHDHSLSYRHRSLEHFYYRDYTLQELTGLVNMIYYKVFKTKRKEYIVSSPNFFPDWNIALFQMTNSEILGIDDRDILTKKLHSNVPKGYFAGKYLKHEMELFVLQSFRSILKLSIEEELTEDIILSKKKDLKTTYIFINEPKKNICFSHTYIKEYIENKTEPELSLLYKHRLVKIIKTNNWCRGTHFYKMGDNALICLNKIKKEKGFLIMNGEDSAMMSDIINIDHFHIGKATNIITSKIMGIPHNSGFIQFVPAGVRTTLAYPTPIQTSKDFSEAIKSHLFKKLSKLYGEEKLFSMITDDANSQGTPIIELLEKIDNISENKKLEKDIEYKFISGVYKDKMPWSGVVSTINTKKDNWNFRAYIAKKEPKNIFSLLEEYKEENNSSDKINLAWNGGYILNPELVGKLGLSEQYIGSPLGLLILDGNIKCPPLFNKPAFIIYKNGQVDILRVSSKNGFTISTKNITIDFESSSYNIHSKEMPSFYDLMYKKDTITGDGNVIIRLAGNIVKEIIYTQKDEAVKTIPVGITLSVPKKIFNKEIFEIDKPLNINLKDNKKNDIKWENIDYAVEAGPLLLDNNKSVLDMKKEGWKTKNSIKTQAARLDFLNMRGPKIAVGISKEGDLKVLAINGRIRESVGATHIDMVEILKGLGIDKAMGFDPGGSSTLFVNGKTLNISPYNKKYEEDIYSLPPEPRFISNIILAWK